MILQGDDQSQLSLHNDFDPSYRNTPRMGESANSRRIQDTILGKTWFYPLFLSRPSCQSRKLDFSRTERSRTVIDRIKSCSFKSSRRWRRKRLLSAYLWSLES